VVGVVPRVHEAKSNHGAYGYPSTGRKITQCIYTVSFALFYSPVLGPLMTLLFLKRELSEYFSLCMPRKHLMGLALTSVPFTHLFPSEYTYSQLKAAVLQQNASLRRTLASV
jgi:hypothetical protein